MVHVWVGHFLGRGMFDLPANHYERMVTRPIRAGCGFLTSGNIYLRGDLSSSDFQSRYKGCVYFLAIIHITCEWNIVSADMRDLHTLIRSCNGSIRHMISMEDMIF